VSAATQPSANGSRPRPDQTGGPPVLEVVEVSAGYEGVTVLRNVSLTVRPGRVVALLGPNGAGKTTLLRTAAGLLKPSAGRVLIKGNVVTRRSPNRRAKAGLCLIPEGRGIFRTLTVRENLRMHLPPWAKDGSVDAAFEAFPILGQRLGQVAGTMSGGQQQMLALARAYLAEPDLILLDEVSMGLAPKVVDEIFEALTRLASTGVALLLVEQYINRALEMADHVVLLDRGQVAYDGSPADLDQATVMRRYLGIDANTS
jgi:branched-chain amino acid transport system ATP-binding protein